MALVIKNLGMVDIPRDVYPKLHLIAFLFIARPVLMQKIFGKNETQNNALAPIILKD